MSIEGKLELKTDGVEVSPGIVLIGQATPVPGTDKLRCLANVDDMLCLVELRIRFAKEPTECE